MKRSREPDDHDDTCVAVDDHEKDGVDDPDAELEAMRDYLEHAHNGAAVGKILAMCKKPSAAILEQPSAPMFKRPSASTYLAPRYYKVKWHHLFHLPDDLTRMRNMPSCFPMERKHNSNQGPCTCLTRSDRASTQHAAEYAEVTLD